MTPKAKPPRNAAGTRGLGSGLKLFRAPVGAARSGDIEALLRGEARRVSCFLRLEPTRRFRQGYLDVSASDVTWHSYWPWHREVLALPTGGSVQQLTPTEAGAKNIKQGPLNQAGSNWGSGGWVVLRFGLAGSEIDLAVPAADAELATLALRGARS